MILNHARLPVPTRPREIYFSSGGAVGLDEGWQEDGARAGALRQAQCERQACTYAAALLSANGVSVLRLAIRRAQCERYSATLRVHFEAQAVSASANGFKFAIRCACTQCERFSAGMLSANGVSVLLGLQFDWAQCERLCSATLALALRRAQCERFQLPCPCTSTGSVRTVSATLRMHCDGLCANGNSHSARALRRSLCERFQLLSACTAMGSVRTVSATLPLHFDRLSANGYGSTRASEIPACT